MNLEDTLNELENQFKEVNNMRFGLLEASLEPFEMLYQDVNGKKIYETLDKLQKQEMISTLKEDLLPLFEENKFEEGIKKVKKFVKLLQENLEEQK